MLPNKQILFITCWQFLVFAALIGVAAGVAYGLNRLELRVSRQLSHHYGWKSLLVTGWLGTSLHEISHLALCKLFRLRVVDYKLYQPDTRTGTLGYVYFVQDKKGILGAISRFFVGTSPLLFGMALLTFGLYWVGWRPPQVELATAQTAWPVFGALSEGFVKGMYTLIRGGHLTNLKFWIWSYVCLAVGLHMAPSRADIKNTAWGWCCVILLLSMALLSWQLISPGGASTIFGITLRVGVPVGVAAGWTIILGSAYFGAVKLITWILP